jgi:phage tail sheath gpL-like
MAISFNQIPSNLRVPIAYFEIDPSQAASYSQVTYALVLGTHNPTRGPLQVGVLTRVRSRFDSEGLCGVGSALARMCAAYFANNQSVPLFVLAAAETGFTAGAGSFTVAGTTQEGGTLPLYVGGRPVRVYLTAGMSADEVAEAMVDAINADPAIGVAATKQDFDVGPPIVPAAALVASSQPGIHGALHLAVAFRGPAYGEIVPPGLTVTAVAMTGMAGVPDVAALVSNLGDELYDFICSPWSDATSLDDLSNLLQDVTGRWSWSQQLYGHAFAYRNDTLGALSTFGNTRNDQHVTLAGWFGSPTPECEIAAAWTGQVAGSAVVSAARPVQTLALLGVVPPRPDDRFQILDRQVLYFDGIACGYVDSGGVMRLERSITTYQKNVWGAPDNSYLDVETLYSLAYFNRFMRSRILLKYPRHKLADDGTRFGAGQAIVTPAIIRSEMIAAYGEMVEAGEMENMEAFKTNLVVERNAQDPNRVDALLPPDLVNGLRIFAALTQFRLRSVSVEAA